MASLEGYARSESLTVTSLTQAPAENQTHRNETSRIQLITTQEYGKELWVILLDGTIEAIPLSAAAEPARTTTRFRPHNGPNRVYEVDDVCQTSSGDIIALCTCDYVREAKPSDSDSSGSGSETDSMKSVTDRPTRLLHIAADGRKLNQLMSHEDVGLGVAARDDAVYVMLGSNERRNHPIIYRHWKETVDDTAEWKREPLGGLALENNSRKILAGPRHSIYCVAPESAEIRNVVVHKFDAKAAAEPQIYERQTYRGSPQLGTNVHLCCVDSLGHVLLVDMRSDDADQYRILHADGTAWSTLTFHERDREHMNKLRDATLDSNGDLYLLAEGWNVYKVEAAEV